MSTDIFMGLAENVGIPALAVAVAVTFIRLWKGPSLPDRVVALDLLTTIGIAIIAVHSIASNDPIFLDVAFILALISFLATVAFAFYIDLRR